MTPFHVGMKVVCVDDVPHGKYMPVGSRANKCLRGLKSGVVYTVRTIGPCPVRGNPCLWLDEIYSSVGPSGFEIGFAIQRFRPAHENRMNELRTLLAPVPSKELVQS